MPQGLSASTEAAPNALLFLSRYLQFESAAHTRGCVRASACRAHTLAPSSAWRMGCPGDDGRTDARGRHPGGDRCGARFVEDVRKRRHPMQNRRAHDVDAWVVAREELHVKVAELVVLVRPLAPRAEEALDGAAARKEERARGVESRAVGSHERRAEQVLAHGAVVVNRREAGNPLWRERRQLRPSAESTSSSVSSARTRCERRGEHAAPALDDGIASSLIGGLLATLAETWVGCSRADRVLAALVERRAAIGAVRQREREHALRDIAVVSAVRQVAPSSAMHLFASRVRHASRQVATRPVTGWRPVLFERWPFRESMHSILGHSRVARSFTQRPGHGTSRPRSP